METGKRKQQADDQTLMADILVFQECLAMESSRLALGCSQAALRDTAWSVMEEEYQIQGELADEMKKRQWISPAPASAEMVDRLRQKLQSS